MGYNHCFLVDDAQKLWGFGDNEMGSLGMGDWKKRLTPQINEFYQDKRVIDVACGDHYSVVICEVYDFDEEDKLKYFEKDDNRNSLMDMKRLKAVKSEKDDVKSARLSICGGGFGKTHVTGDLKIKIESLLKKTNDKKSAREQKSAKKLRHLNK